MMILFRSWMSYPCCQAYSCKPDITGSLSVMRFGDVVARADARPRCQVCGGGKTLMSAVISVMMTSAARFPTPGMVSRRSRAALCSGMLEQLSQPGRIRDIFSELN